MKLNKPFYAIINRNEVCGNGDGPCVSDFRAVLEKEDFDYLSRLNCCKLSKVNIKRVTLQLARRRSCRGVKG